MILVSLFHSVSECVFVFCIKRVVGSERRLTYFFGYKKEYYFIQNNPKNLDLSYKTDLDLWDSLGRVKLLL